MKLVIDISEQAYELFKGHTGMAFAFELDYDRAAEVEWAIKNGKLLQDVLKEETIYDYPVKDLILFACACREQHITKEELHNFVDNALAGYQFGYNDFVNAYTKAMDEIFGEHDFKFNWEKKKDE